MLFLCATLRAAAIWRVQTCTVLSVRASICVSLYLYLYTYTYIHNICVILLCLYMYIYLCIYLYIQFALNTPKNCTLHFRFSPAHRNPGQALAKTIGRACVCILYTHICVHMFIHLLGKAFCFAYVYIHTHVYYMYIHHCVRLFLHLLIMFYFKRCNMCDINCQARLSIYFLCQVFLRHGGTEQVTSGF